MCSTFLPPERALNRCPRQQRSQTSRLAADRRADLTAGGCLHDKLKLLRGAKNRSAVRKSGRGWSEAEFTGENIKAMRLSTAALAARRAFAAASHSGHEGGGQCVFAVRNDLSSSMNSAPGASVAACFSTARTWKILTIVLAFPGVSVCMANAYVKGQEHPHEQPDFVAYSHLRIRTKKFPWGDGNHSLFHNAHTNALPEGYESSHH
ncbi:Cytochrome c oxidase subunit 6A, mitochondrial [Takifugu flavidus]|uniref:Cytochrome c oxidase subunit n=1 Tax=Takifugu flavidus TaxID=433684 RepID=A0A5C6NS83_9TELE|nr:Cytochrome c oxidase subunit 6A, mitochondrial [Takifugu flavidus]